MRRQQTNLLQHVLFQMSPLPVCVVSLLPCGAPEAAKPSSISGSGGHVKGSPCSPVSQDLREQPARPAEDWDLVGMFSVDRPRLGQEPVLSHTLM